MDDLQRYQITCTYRYYGYPEAERDYIIVTDCLEMKVHYYGNHGYDAPEVSRNIRKCNGYFWDLHRIMKALYTNALDLSDFKEGETKTIKLNRDGKREE